MQQKDKIVRLVETGEAIVGLRNDGILHIYYKSGTEITVPLQETMLQLMKEVGGPQLRPYIYEAAEYVTVNKEARDNAIAMEAHVPYCCSVVYVTNLAHKMVAEFYYRFNKPKKPYKVVTDFQTGIEWLTSNRSQNQSTIS